MALTHGGDTYGFFLEYGTEPLDFSANCNPLGVPDAVAEAICGAARSADRYPDPLCRELCAAIARDEGVEPSAVLCGNGSADLIFRLALAEKPRTALVTAPTFSEYETALRTVGCEVIHHELKAEDGFAVTESLLERLTPNIAMLFVCNPNNPTGLITDNMLMDKISEKCESMGILFVVDECFNGFLDEPDINSLKKRLRERKRLLILKAFTKLYGAAGLRLGYCLSSDLPLLERMRAAGQPWAVSSLAQAGGIAALMDGSYVETTRALIKEERGYLLGALRELGLVVYDGAANYIFFNTAVRNLGIKMRRKGVLIRNCSNYPGLSEGYFRIAVRMHPENVSLVKALSETLGKG